MSVFRRKRAAKNGKTRADATWTVEFADHDGVTRRLAAFTDRSASVELERHIKRLVSLRMAGAGPDAELSRFLEAYPATIRNSLAKWGIITGQRAAAGKSLAHHVADWKVAMEAKGNCTDHVKQFVSNVHRLADDCGWCNLTIFRPQTPHSGFRRSGAGKWLPGPSIITCAP